MQRSLQFLALVAAVAVVVGGAGAIAIVADEAADPAPKNGTESGPSDGQPGFDEAATVEQFESAAAFEEYVRAANRQSTSYVVGGPDVAVEPTADAERQTVSTESAQAGSGDGGSGGDVRVSDTNVQVTGVDEPDRLKTAPGTLYYADGWRYRTETGGKTRVIDASEPASPVVRSEISDSGRLLLVNETLVVLGQDRISGYDVSGRENPERVWATGLNAQIRTARLSDGRIHLVLQQGVDLDDPCPVEPFTDGPGTPCTDVYHPTGQTDASVTYTVVSMDPASGQTHDRVSFLGTRTHSATYVDNDSIYLTYTERASRAETFGGYLRSSDLLDEQARARLDELAGYDLSPAARQMELNAVVEDWLARQDGDEREELRTLLYEGYREYVDERKRSLLRSGIVRVDVEGDSLTVAETGSVPGRPLNQWALDEHNGTLRIATTVDPMGATSVNDLYTLDDSLDVRGSVRDLGETERIYSVRYQGDTAYVVTFRQVDPFYVVDLSNPADPTVRGELKLPGFSRYLHPLSEDRILGIGREDGQVKATVFDVSDPSSPTVAESTVVDARWSAIARTHHAFLYDQRHGVFFLPTERGGYVFDTSLNQETFVETNTPATRAAYVGDYLYVFSSDGLTVVDETTWRPVNVLSFDGGQQPVDGSGTSTTGEPEPTTTTSGDDGGTNGTTTTVTDDVTSPSTHW
ncbi:beta-propeller domain-containing protein [Haloarchaeobius sp. HRN-SO-5]|uniref:beta-propeller domain-containing protein n=1 Tax=Haloarchaeobius sp. HRN-SO-5 TaxID=3446118 RepID=UPI003EBE92F6